MRHKSRLFLSLLLILLFCAQAHASIPAPCASCHLPAAASCAAGAAHSAQLTRACCCEIATSAKPDRDSAALFVVEYPVKNSLNFLPNQELLTLPSLQPIVPGQTSLPQRTSGTAPPLFILHSAYLI